VCERERERERERRREEDKTMMVRLPEIVSTESRKLKSATARF
jgi:hypothetical protein